MKAYFIPGLAADSRVFRHIRLPEGYEAQYLDWLPHKEGESLRDYAMRMAAQLDQKDPFVLCGLSLGGMLAVEIAKAYQVEKLILIASISHHSHLPFYYRKAVNLGLHRLLTPSMIKYGVYLKRYFTSESREDKAIIRQMARDADHAFIRWAVEAVVNWQTEDNMPIVCHHIHGSNDLVLPHRFTRPSITIKRAGHLMVFNRAEDINSELRKILKAGV